MRIALIVILGCLLGGLAAAQTVPLPQEPSWMSDETNYNGTGLDIGDVDGNGWLDLAVSNGNDIVQAPNLVYLNQGGDLPTTASWASTDQRYSGHCQLADIDDDGYPELMVANYIGPGWTTAQVQVYDNVNGVLEQYPSWESPADIHTFRASFGDPDGDGDLDLAVATGESYNGYAEQNLVFFNVDGQLEATAGWRSTLYDECYDAKFVDYDVDGDQDLAFLGGGGGRVTIYENEGGVLATSPAWMTAGDDDGNTFDFDDLDGDGRPDMLVGFNNQLGGSGRFAVFLTGGGPLPTVPTWTSDLIGYCSAVVCADLDRQNGPDLVCGGWWEPMRVYLNDGSGGFATAPDWQTLDIYSSVVENIALADLDEGRTRPETAFFPAGSQLLELPHRHLQRIDGIFVDGNEIPADRWCASLRDGWISLDAPLAGEAEVDYQVSDGLDLAISNWDDATFVFRNLLPTGTPDARPPSALLSEVRVWPNPFNPRTTIGLRLAADVDAARLRVYDLRGRLIETLHEWPLAAGEHRVEWLARGVASGVYLYRVEAGGAVEAGKVVLTK